MPRLHQVVVQVLELAGIHIFDYDDGVIGGVQGPFEIGRHGGMVRHIGTSGWRLSAAYHSEAQ